MSGRSKISRRTFLNATALSSVPIIAGAAGHTSQPPVDAVEK